MGVRAVLSGAETGGSGVEGGVVQPVQGQLAAMGRVGAGGAAGVGAVGGGRVFGGVRVGLSLKVLVRIRDMAG